MNVIVNCQTNRVGIYLVFKRIQLEISGHMLSLTLLLSLFWQTPHRRELVISDPMLIPNECVTLGQGECLSEETTASANTPTLAVWLTPAAYHVLNHLWGEQRQAVLRTASVNGRTRC